MSATLTLNISKTTGGSGLFSVASLWESAQGQSNGHVTDGYM